MLNERQEKKPRRRIGDFLSPKVCEEYRHRETKALIRILRSRANGDVDVFNCLTGKTRRVRGDSLRSTCVLAHAAIRAKVGTGPGTIITINTPKPPAIGEMVQFCEELNGKWQGGLVDDQKLVGGESIYFIARM